MIKKMVAHTSVRTGRTCYTVYYDNGKHTRERKLKDSDNWPMSVVKFFTAEDTVRTEDKIVGAGQYATRYERFEKANA